MPPVNAAWLSNDETNHRLRLSRPSLAFLPIWTGPLHHVAFEYRTLDELLGTCARLKGAESRAFAGQGS